MTRHLTEQPLEVFDYTSAKLSSLLETKSLPRSVLQSGADFSQVLEDEKPYVIAQKKLCVFLCNYFESEPRKASTILSENRYVDIDYLKDHTEYYNRCFRRYNRHCVRLHFFENTFNEEDYLGFLAGDRSKLTEELLQNNYLGFVIVKPLPKTFIGRTCLVPKGNFELDSKFPVVRDYTVSLFGAKLLVRSLAFQEQDNVVAACATSALWSLFHKTGVLFQHEIPSPSEITKDATKTEISIIKKGLLQAEVNSSIRKLRLEPLEVAPISSFHFRSLVYSYLSFGVPIFMGHFLYDTAKTSNNILGGHATTITGYGISHNPVGAEIGVNKYIYLTSSRIKEIYTHDDQVGPFVKCTLDDKAINHDGQEVWSFHTPYDNGDFRAFNITLTIPLYRKIRISYDAVYQIILHFNKFVEDVKSQDVGLKLDTALEWDIKLTNIQQFKESILAQSEMSFPSKSDILLKSMPKYLWRCTGSLFDGQPVIEFVFDATDLEQGMILSNCICYEETLRTLLINESKDLLEDMKKNKVIHMSQVWQIFAWFKNKSPT